MKTILCACLALCCIASAPAQSISVFPSSSIRQQVQLGHSPGATFWLANTSYAPAKLQAAINPPDLPVGWNFTIEVNGMLVEAGQKPLSLGLLKSGDSIEVFMALNAMEYTGEGCLRMEVWETGKPKDGRTLDFCGQIISRQPVFAKGEKTVHYLADVNSLCFLNFGGWRARIKSQGGATIGEANVYGTQFLLALEGRGMNGVKVELTNGEEKMQEFIVLLD